MKNDALGDRMKGYESASASVLTPRMPILIRVDGRAFHTLTRGLHCFDSRITTAMNAVAKGLMEEAQGAVMGYVQSDEVSILLQTDARPETQPWFGGKIQKICSIAAAQATVDFNLALDRVWCPDEVPVDEAELYAPPVGMFDARCWNMPWEDVANYFLWRLKDATRNSTSAYARTMFSHKALHKKSVDDMRDMIHEQVFDVQGTIANPNPHYGKSTWEGLPTRDRQGWFFIKDGELTKTVNAQWNRQKITRLEYGNIDSMLKMARSKLREQ